MAQEDRDRDGRVVRSRVRDRLIRRWGMEHPDELLLADVDNA